MNNKLNGYTHKNLNKLIYMYIGKKLKQIYTTKITDKD